MGKIMSIMVRQSRRVFVQERAERIISKPKPTVHPYYPTEEKIMKQIKAEHPELGEKIYERYPTLEERVSNISITSQELPQISGQTRKAIESGAKKDHRLLPEDRRMHPEPELGFFEPSENKIQRGRILFSKAMEMLRLREESMDKAKNFAYDFGINESITKAILQHFAPFTNAIDMIDEKKATDRIDETKKELIGHRAILQKQRAVSDLEERRITAKLLDSNKAASTAGSLEDIEDKNKK